MTSHGFVNGIIDNLVDHMVQAVRPRGTNVHSRSFSNSFETFEYLNRVGTVVIGFWGQALPPGS
jgi:hypothetical protein